MSRQIILNGTVANDGTGDNLRVTANKINANFSELYANDAELYNWFRIDANGDLEIVPPGGDLYLNAVVFKKPIRLGAAADPGTTGQVLTSTGSTTAPVWQNLPVDQNTTYIQSAETTTGGALLRLTGSDATNDEIKLASGTNVTITRTDANTITVSSVDTNTTYSQSAVVATGGVSLRLTGSDQSSDDVKLVSGTNVTITRTDADTITFSSIDTKYTHSAETTTGGALLRLAGSDTTNDDVKLIAGANLTITRTDADTITFVAADQRLSIVEDSSSNTSLKLMMTPETSGRINDAKVDSADLTYNPSTGTLSTPNLLVSASGVDFTGANNALYYSAAENRVTLANYNAGGKLTFEVAAGSYTAHFNADGTYQFANLYAKAVGAAPKPVSVGSDGIIGYDDRIATKDTLYDAGTHTNGATLSLDRNNGTIQKVTLASNVTDIVVANITAAQSFTIIFTQDATGSRTLSTNSAFKYASGFKTLSTAVGSVDMMNMFFDGSTYYTTLTTGYA